MPCTLTAPMPLPPCRGRGAIARLLRPVALAGAVLALAGGVAAARADELKIGGTGTGLATMQLLAQAYAKQDAATRITVLPSLGSGGGIKAVLSGVIQVAVSSRPLKDTEVRQGAVGVPYGSTPFVLATAASNPVASLSTKELVDIYAGRIEQWSDGQRIRLVLRPVGDTDSEMIKSISAEMREAKTAAEQRKGMPFAVTDQDAADALEKTSGALGPTTLAQILTEKRRLKALALDGVAPSPETIANGRYGLKKELILVTGPKATPAARQFVAFVRSPTAQEILRQHGYWVQ